MGWAEVSPEQHREITAIANEARAPAGQLTQQYLAGIDQQPRASLLQNQNSQMFGLNNRSMLEAIQRKSDVKFGRELDQLKRRAGIDAVNDKFNRMNQAAGLVNAEFQHNERVKAAKYAERMNRRAARGAMLGNILGIAGAVGGAIVGGPAGAMAGYGVGQGVGQMAGQGGM